jgi:hypothetical protein
MTGDGQHLQFGQRLDADCDLVHVPMVRRRPPVVVSPRPGSV